MSHPILEATAVIRGEDRTGAMFKAIEARIGKLNRMIGAVNTKIPGAGALPARATRVSRQVEAAEKALAGMPLSSSTARRVENVAANIQARVASFTQTMEAMANAEAAIARAAPRGRPPRIPLVPMPAGASRVPHGRGGAHLHSHARISPEGEVHGGLMLGGGIGLMTTIGAGILGTKAVEASAEQQHEQVRMQAAGMTPAEIAEANHIVSDLSQKYRPLSTPTLLHMLRNARSVVGTYAEAAKIIDTVAQMRVAVEAAHPGKNMEDDFDKLIKAMELKGVTQDLPAFRTYMDRMSKALNTFGDTLTPIDYYNAFKYGRQSTRSLSEDYIMSVAPTLAQEMKGAQAGTAHQAFFRAIVGNRMSKKARAEMGKYGLLGKDGAPIGRDLAAANPYLWTNEILLPHLRAHGVTTPEQIQQAIAELATTGVEGQLLSILATQQSRIEKDAKLALGAQGLEAATTYMNQDPQVAFQGVMASAKNFGAALGLTNAYVAGQLNYFSDTLNYYAAKLNGYEPSRDNPIVKENNKIANREKFGLDDDRDFSKLPLKDLYQAKRAADVQKLEELERKKLELAGANIVLAQRRQDEGFIPSWGTLRLAQHARALEYQIRKLEQTGQIIAQLDAAWHGYQDMTARLRVAHEFDPKKQPDYIPQPNFLPQIPISRPGDYSAVPGPENAYLPQSPAPPAQAASPAPHGATYDSIVNPSPYGQLQVDVEGNADVNVTVHVQVDKGLIASEVDRQIKTKIPFHGNLGRSSPETDPNL